MAIKRQIHRVAIVGAGYMGGDIAQAFAAAGPDAVIVDADTIATRRHLERLRGEAKTLSPKAF